MAHESGRALPVTLRPDVRNQQAYSARGRRQRAASRPTGSPDRRRTGAGARHDSQTASIEQPLHRRIAAKEPGRSRALDAFPHRQRARCVERARAGSQGLRTQRRRSVPWQALCAGARHAVYRVRAHRQPVALGGGAIRTPHAPAPHRAGGVPGRQGALPRRYRRWHLGDLRRDFLGRPRPHGAQKRGVGLPDVEEPIIELFSAETGALLAWTHYLLGQQIDKVHPLIRERLEAEIERRLLSVYRKRQDFGWMGLNNDQPVNNWNPWINSNLLTCALLMDADPARRAQTVHKILTSLDRFLDSYHDDGGCDEGAGYWNRAGAALFECLDLLRSASQPSVNFFDLPLVRQIGAYIYKVHIAGDWYVNFADAAAKVKPDGSLLYRFGKATGDGDLQAFGAYQYQHSGAGMESLGRAFRALFQGEEISRAEARDPLVREAWFDGIQVAAARKSAGSTEGFYFAALGGHNAESHNHNDVGNFVVYLNGNPVLIDVGVENYTAKTFSSKRYEIWTMQSAYHNLPTINGVMKPGRRQCEARDVASYKGDGEVEFTEDLASSYLREAGKNQSGRSVA